MRASASGVMMIVPEDSRGGGRKPSPQAVAAPPFFRPCGSVSWAPRSGDGTLYRHESLAMRPAHGIGYVGIIGPAGGSFGRAAVGVDLRSFLSLDAVRTRSGSRVESDFVPGQVAPACAPARNFRSAPGGWVGIQDR